MLFLLAPVPSALEIPLQDKAQNAKHKPAEHGDLAFREPPEGQH